MATRSPVALALKPGTRMASPDSLCANSPLVEYVAARIPGVAERRVFSCSATSFIFCCCTRRWWDRAGRRQGDPGYIQNPVPSIFAGCAPEDLRAKSTSREIATCPAINPLPQLNGELLSAGVRAESFSAGATRTFSVRKAGASPNEIPVSRDTPTVNQNTRASGERGRAGSDPIMFP